MIQGVLFDMDGVLLDTERITLELLMKAANALGYPYTPEIFQMILGKNAQMTGEVYLQVFGPDFPEAELHRQLQIRLTEVAKCGKMPFKPGFETCMDGLRTRHIPAALATSTDRDLVDVYFQAYPAFREAFAVTVCGMEVPNGKPKPDIYLLAAEKLGLSPDHCLGVEDSQYGLMSLRAAGAASVMIPDLLPYNREVAPYADHVLTDLTQVCPLIDSLNR